MSRTRRVALTLMTMIAAALPGVARAVVPVDGGTVGGSTIAVDVTGGDQLDPHVSGDLAAYTDASDPTGQAIIRYYDFRALVSPNAFIPASMRDDTDTLSDVNGNHIAFSRYDPPTGLNRCMVYDVVSAVVIQIGSASAVRATALGSDTVAFVNGASLEGDILAGRISAPSAPLTHVSASFVNNIRPAVSPAGDVIVWAACPSGSFTNCTIMESILRNGVWSVPSVVWGAPSDNPDTDGTIVVYDSSGDVYYRPVGGGAATQLVLDGVERNPSIAGGVIAFESSATLFSAADLFIYQISSNTVFRVTNTQSVINESLNDVTVLPNGDVRVVWALNDDWLPTHRNIYARTFTLPAIPDTTAPAVTITTPADGALYAKNQVVSADYACEDEPGGSGLFSCEGPVASGAAIDTASIGGHFFTVTGSDNAGNEATLEHEYGVVFNASTTSFFSQPVDNLPVLNSARAGQSVPVKFSLGGDQGLAVFAPGYPKSQLVLCDSSAPVDGIEETVTAGGTSLSYDAASGLYKYIWKTDKSWAGSCRQLVLGLVDGTFRHANFMFR